MKSVQSRAKKVDGLHQKTEMDYTKRLRFLKLTTMEVRRISDGLIQNFKSRDLLKRYTLFVVYILHLIVNIRETIVFNLIETS